jgi:peptide/nickel transport system ATP-binding protein
MTDVLDMRELSVEIEQGGNTLRPVTDVSVRVAAGETACIVGESGSGKSMTAFAIAGLLPRNARRTASSILIGRQETRCLGAAEMQKVRGRMIGYIFQDPMTSLNPVVTVGDQLTDGFLFHRLGSSADATRRATHLLERVGISDPTRRLREYPHQLSGGLRQRVMIAMALMCSPKLLIADEPTTALDVTTQAQILTLLKDLQHELGMAMLLITHDLGVVSAVGDRVYVMYAGQIVEEGPTAGVFENPAHPYLAALLSCIPVPGSTPRGSRLPSIPGVVPLVTKDLVGCAFRNRCNRAVDQCSRVSPPITSAHATSVRCHAPLQSRETGRPAAARINGAGHQVQR